MTVSWIKEGIRRPIKWRKSAGLAWRPQTQNPWRVWINHGAQRRCDQWLPQHSNSAAQSPSPAPGSKLRRLFQIAILAIQGQLESLGQTESVLVETHFLLWMQIPAHAMSFWQHAMHEPIRDCLCADFGQCGRYLSIKNSSCLSQGSAVYRRARHGL